MSEFKPTPSQKAAIDTRGRTILVSAAAGSGKTKVLTQRLMSYILDPNDPKDIDTFLIITFTKAAAAELKSRIMDGIAEELERQPDNKRLRRQSALCANAKIGTIHSFCQSVIRDNCHILGLSPEFKVADEDRAQAIRLAALERVLDERYENHKKYEGFLTLADTVGAGRDDSRLSQVVLSVYNKMQSHARPELWAKARIDELSLTEDRKIEDTLWGKDILESAEQTALYWAKQFESLAESMTDEKIKKAYAPAISQASSDIYNLADAISEGWDAAMEASDITFGRLGSLRNYEDEDFQNYAKAKWDDGKKAVKKLVTWFKLDTKQLAEDIASSSVSMNALMELVFDFDKEYSDSKKRASLVDFSDLEHYAARLLTEEDGSPTKLAKELSAKFTEIMVDEYQDVSRVQDAIFKAVSKDEKNLFMVGDVKQSIYRFRLADPSIFIEKYDNFGSLKSSGEGEPARIMLKENFRSRNEIINGANAVFETCMSRQLGEVTYDSDAALVCGATYYEGEVPVPELVLINAAGDSEDDSEAPSTLKAETTAVAEMIKKMVDEKTMITSSEGLRPMRYGDVAILIRSANTVVNDYRKALAQLGISSQSGQGGDFFNSVEISCVTDMLCLIDNPHQDIPLVSVLRSPAFCFTPDELSEIRAKDRNSDFYTALKKAASDNSKAESFVTLLEEMRTYAPDMEMGELLWFIYNKLDIMALCNAMTDAENRRQNLMLMLEYAKKYEATGYRGLHRFVGWLDKLAQRDAGPSASTESADCVQIMSIHKSKGLEFPVVFLCSTATKFNLKDSSETVLVHPELGFGPKVTDAKRHLEYPTLPRLAIASRTKRESLSEEMRLLYVAMTRPKERLIITAAVKDPYKLIEESKAKAEKPMDPEVLSSCGSFHKWVLMSCLADNTGSLSYRVYNSDKSDDDSRNDVLQDDVSDNELVEKLRKNLEYEYPYKESVSLPSKITATELKSRAEETDDESASIAPKRNWMEFRLPKFEKKDKKLSAAAKGTATHHLLELIDVSKTNNPEDVKVQIEKLRNLEKLSSDESEAIDVEDVVKLYSSEIGQRMKKADKLNREFRFSVLLPAERFFKNGGDEEILLQGAVDCWFEEDGEIVIVDYKTDKVTEENVRERADEYYQQINAYSMALSAITGKKIRNAVLYFLEIGKTVVIS